jgi:Xaa-Pro aminopeptidase
MNHECFLRQQRLQQVMREQGIDAFILIHDIALYYFTGTIQNGYLLVPAEGESVFFIRKSVSRGRQDYAGRVEPLGSMADLAAMIPKEKPVIALEFDVTPMTYFNRLQKTFPDAIWKDGTSIVRELRMIKSAQEIEKIREAARVLDTALNRVLGHIRPGMTEYELLAKVDYEMKLMGHIGFMKCRGYNQYATCGVILSGAAAAVPAFFDGPAGGEGISRANPQGAGNSRFERNSPILLDVGCCVDGYVIDQTRTAVIGKLPDELQRAYEVTESIARETERQMRPGVVCEDLYDMSLKMAEDAGLLDHYMGYKDDRARFLGHGIGLELDELPVLAERFKTRLAPGMVIATEPKFTFPGQGVVGTEDSYLITETGWERLSLTKQGLIHL